MQLPAAAVSFFLLVLGNDGAVGAFSFVTEVSDWLSRENVPWREVTVRSIVSNSEVNSNLCYRFHQSQTVLFELCLPDDVQQGRLFLHLLPSPNRREDCVDMYLCRDLTNAQMAPGKTESSIIHLHEDVWNAKQSIVRNRLLARCGMRVHRIFARKTVVRRIAANVAREFLEEHHLWSATRTAKHNYGLFLRERASVVDEEFSPEMLVAVATFSKGRNVVRGTAGEVFRSHELLRFCTRQRERVVGGLTKLIKAFVMEQEPDDIVTVVDRDWGSGSGWHALGFVSVHTMDPLVMAVKDGLRRHLVGAGIQHGDSTGTRRGLPLHVLEQLNSVENVEHAVDILSQYEFFPVYDAGVERLMLLLDEDSHCDSGGRQEAVKNLWDHSRPSYAATYYSDNSGIATLLRSDTNGKVEPQHP